MHRESDFVQNQLNIRKIFEKKFDLQKQALESELEKSLKQYEYIEKNKIDQQLLRQQEEELTRSRLQFQQTHSEM